MCLLVHLLADWLNECMCVPFPPLDSHPGTPLSAWWGQATPPRKECGSEWKEACTFLWASPQRCQKFCCPCSGAAPSPQGSGQQDSWSPASFLPHCYLVSLEHQWKVGVQDAPCLPQKKTMAGLIKPWLFHRP